MQKNRCLSLFKYAGVSVFLSIFSSLTFASEAELKIPPLTSNYNVLGMAIPGTTLMGIGMLVAVVGMLFGLMEFMKIKKLPAHRSMLEVSALIYETCKTYLLQQARFLAILELLIGASIFYYFFFLQHLPFARVVLI